MRKLFVILLPLLITLTAGAVMVGCGREEWEPTFVDRVFVELTADASSEANNWKVYTVEDFPELELDHVSHGVSSWNILTLWLKEPGRQNASNAFLLLLAREDVKSASLGHMDYCYLQ
ncbi:MAG: hypothetical protein LBG88_02540 [Christensenellaceae bacterium]|jgi:hypothetical protein|nr:hypothetical protein [Christensenellaceae bacterium]